MCKSSATNNKTREFHNENIDGSLAASSGRHTYSVGRSENKTNKHELEDANKNKRTHNHSTHTEISQSLSLSSSSTALKAFRK